MTVSDGMNFDPLATKFLHNIYGTPKGKIRERILRRDLLEVLPQITTTPLRILDAGGGAGQGVEWLAAQHPGHRFLLCDLSQKLLEEAGRNLAGIIGEGRVTLVHGAIQSLDVEEGFDLILCHAVLEWVEDQRNLLACLRRMLRPGGTLSLMVYNLQGLIFRHLQNENFAAIASGEYGGSGTGLKPTHPCRPVEVERWLEEEGIHVLLRSGIRVFYDYMMDEVRRTADLGAVLAMEERMSRQEPFLHLARYLHLVGRCRG